MAASGGHLLVPKALRLIKYAAEKTGRFVRDKFPQAAKPTEADLQPAYVRVTQQQQRQPVHRLAQIRQSQSRWYSTNFNVANTIRQFSSRVGPRAQPSRAAYPPSRTATAVGRSTGRAPFASTLRPNLTGGTLCRSSGGYGLGGGRAGGARYFSHSPAAPAQVVTNVSQAVRAFWLSGQKARFDGANPQTGEKRFRAVSSIQEDARQTMDLFPSNAPGSFIDFKVSPTITAIGPLSNVPRATSVETSCEHEQDTLNNAVMIATLSIDFARALKDLAAIMNDLKHLSSLGDLPIFLHNSTTLRVRFPGCDADTVESLCRELNIKRGIVGQDEDFDIHNGTDMALLFPFAPSKNASEVGSEACYEVRPNKRAKRDRLDWHEMMLSPPQHSSAGFSHVSATSQSAALQIIDDAMGENPWISSPSGYSSLHASELYDEDDGDNAAMYFFQPGNRLTSQSKHTKSLRGNDGYEGVEGIYRFIEECDRARS